MGTLDSNWNIEELLLGLRTAGAQFERVDDGVDLLACSLRGSVPARFIYIYLYGDDDNAIYYDLEDENVETTQWDSAVERGEVRTVPQLAALVSAWLFNASLIESCDRVVHD